MERQRFKQRNEASNSGAAGSSQTTNLCFIVASDYRALGGAMTRFRSEVQHFSKKGHCVTVVYSSKGKEEDINGGPVEYYNIPHAHSSALPLYQIRLFFKCLNMKLSQKRLVFITHEPISLLPPAFLRFVGLFSKTVLVMHGPMATETSMRGHKAFALLLKLVDQIAFAVAGKIVAVSEYEQKYALRLGAEPGKMTIIRNGVEFPQTIEPSSFRQDMGIPTDRILIGYLGSIAGYRGTEFLIEGFSIAKNLTKASLALVLVFREELTEEQKRRIAESAKTACEDLYISNPRTDVFPVLSTFDIYASHFSKKIDGIGFSIMEAMGSGLPVITGRDPITCKLLRNDVDAILVDKENPQAIAEAAKRLAEDASLRKRIGLQARKKALSTFSRHHMLTMCEKVYLNEASN